MPRILKQIHSRRRSVDAFSLGADLDLPGGDMMAAMCEEVYGQTPSEEEEFDPEAVRQAVMEEARAEAAVKVKEAYAEGLNRGRQAGQEAFEASIAQVTEMLSAASRQLHEARQRYLDGLTPQVSALAVMIAEKVLRRAVAEDPEYLHRTVREALGKLTDRQVITLHVHPKDFEALTAHKITLLEDFNGVEELNLEADEGVEPGSCVIASGTMEIDATLTTLIERVVEKMYDG